MVVKFGANLRITVLFMDTGFFMNHFLLTNIELNC